MAVICWLAPAAIVGDAGVTAIEDRVGAADGERRLPEIAPSVAEIELVPAATPWASPPVETVATAGEPEAQVTEPVMFWVRAVRVGAGGGHLLVGAGGDRRRCRGDRDRGQGRRG